MAKVGDSKETGVEIWFKKEDLTADFEEKLRSRFGKREKPTQEELKLQQRQQFGREL